MKVFTDDEMNALLPNLRPYSVAILKAGPQFGKDGSQAIIWEHGRRNFGLRDDGVLAIVLPVADGSEVCGIGVFAATVEETAAIMNDDPGVRAAVFTFEVHPCGGFSRGFPPLAGFLPNSLRSCAFWLVLWSAHCSRKALHR